MRTASLVIAPLLLLCAPVVLPAEPILLEDARLIPQDGAPEGGFGRSADIDGNVAVVGATNGSSVPERAARGAAYVFERQSNGTWLQVAKLLPLGDEPPPGDGDSNFGISVAVEGDTIVAGSHIASETAVFERRSGVWTRAATLLETDGFFVDIHSGTIISSHFDSGDGGDLYRRGPSGWARVQRVTNGHGLGDTDYPGANVAISATTAIHGSYGLDDVMPGTAFIYPLGPDHTWQGAPVAAITRPNARPDPDGFSSRVGISDSTAVIGGNGAHIFERNAQGAWKAVLSLREGVPAVDGNTVIVGTAGGFLRVYRRTSPGVWAHQATLATSTDEFLGEPRIRGNRVIAGRYVFTLPGVIEPAPPLVQEDLQDGLANGWVPQTSSSFSVVSAGGSRVYRQTNTTSGASAIYSSADAEEQSIQADVTPRAYATPAGERWFGLIVRYTDALNHYYITVRNSNTVQLKRMHNGVFQTLASAPLPVVLNRTYSLRLEAHAEQLRVFVDGALVIDATDDALTHGRAGIAMFRTQADFDNLIVGPNPRLLLKVENFDGPFVAGWEPLDFNYQWTKPTADRVFTQPTTGGGGHAVTGPDNSDQIIRARMRATAFSGADRWFGLIGRYIDPANYYYVTVRSSNTISLRKLTNNVITVLDSASMPVAVNTWYALRLEIVGNALRAYVNGRLVLEATDNTAPHVTGRFGLGSFKTAAQADDFLAIQP